MRTFLDRIPYRPTNFEMKSKAAAMVEIAGAPAKGRYGHKED
jgi:hypothetical protein